ncbi:MAG: hypothetical protein ACM3X4_00805 [Ignavibacteriales bacterium]
MGRLAVASAIIWAAVIIAPAMVVPGEFARLIPVLGGGAAARLIIIGAQARR